MRLFARPTLSTNSVLAKHTSCNFEMYARAPNKSITDCDCFQLAMQIDSSPVCSDRERLICYNWILETPRLPSTNISGSLLSFTRNYCQLLYYLDLETKKEDWFRSKSSSRFFGFFFIGNSDLCQRFERAKNGWNSLIKLSVPRTALCLICVCKFS